jgi:deferrochelatase/peroxidase EfeB
MNPHIFVNVVIPFSAANLAATNTAISALADPAVGNYPSAVIRQSLLNVKGLHYMSLTVAGPLCPAEIDAGPASVPATTKGSAWLLIELCSDTGSDECLSALAVHFVSGPGNAVPPTPGLTSVLSAAGFIVGANQVLPLLLKHRVVIGDSWGSTLGQVFTGSPGMRVERIIGERALAAHIGKEIHSRRGTDARKEATPKERLEAIRSSLWNDRETNWKWAFVPEPAPCLGAAPDGTPSILNPQIWKAAGTILNKLVWPLYPPVIGIVLWVFVYAWRHDDLIVAFMWAACVTAAVVAAFAAGLFALLLRLRFLERRDPVEDRPPSTEHGTELQDKENFGGQNHMATLSRLKPGLLRRLTLRLAFVVVGTGRFVSAPGFLGKNGVIHFARWMRLPGTNQLLFWSNYDNTWESYVADFITDAPTGVTGIWSNCVGFPRTRGLFGGGAADRARLVHWARRQQQPTRFWYSAYRDLTAARIRINAAIRQGVATAESAQDCQDWLALFGSAVRPPDSLQTQEIPTLVYGGLSSLRYSQALGYSLSGDLRHSKSFVAWLSKYARFGEAVPGQCVALSIGFSVTGLGRLGIQPDAIETFPSSFKQGMVTPARARELGDTMANDPSGWTWGQPGKDVDVFLVVYCVDETTLNAMGQQIRGHAEALGHSEVFALVLTPLPDDRNAAQRHWSPPRDPFGFVDGISQPIIRGAPHWNTRKAANQVVEAGEFVLGYPDNVGVIPPSPTIRGADDPDQILPEAGPDAFRKRPEFSSYEGTGRKDLGRNGSFMVVRQLEQNILGFRRWINSAIDLLEKNGSIAADSSNGPFADPNGGTVRVKLLGPEAQTSIPTSPLTAAEIAGFPRPPPIIAVRPPGAFAETVRDLVGSKLMGRWSDGTSLVRHHLPPPPPGQIAALDPARTPDNDFLYGQEDPRGLACPFGAHIRRANPRDTRFPGSSEEIASINRHRLLRVGRIYGSLFDPAAADGMLPADGHGLLFMCLNGDIERQFEFVQKTWLLNPSIHGLENEVDPFIGRGSQRFTIPTTTGPICLPPSPGFVTVKGGGYFFLPSRTTLRFLSARQV